MLAAYFRADKYKIKKVTTLQTLDLSVQAPLVQF